ncbi:hypothetical protein DHL47_08210 [Streptococcus panodentis]|uniref:Uncharacterized protein n=1 Tax=Streptococcus panodentis TaxID=1581472 RepID=A0ABS5AXC1_9STRE|nr:hypothetical protein [Streptococcus panodentis]MBP2621298.1 hypothetical protein [Streptococcus panodentis]
MMAAPSPTEGAIFGKIPYKKSFSLALFWKKTLDAVADWTFCSSFRLQKAPNHPRGAGTTN